MQPYQKPIYWSVSKVLVSTVVRILEERGQIDTRLPIDLYIPELSKSSFAGISVRHILDMRTGLDCGDDYENRNSCYYRYSMAIGDGYRTPDALDNPYDFVASLRAAAVNAPGQRHSYSGVNTFVLSWLVEKVTHVPFQDAFTREVWWNIGAEADAAFLAPRYGIAVTHGGFMARLRDLARFGLLFTPSYPRVTDRPIVSSAYLKLLLQGGDAARADDPSGAGAGTNGAPRSLYQWDAVTTDGTMFKGGWAGQGLLVNAKWDVVVVYAGYFKDDRQSEAALAPVLFRVLNGVFGTALEAIEDAIDTRPASKAVLEMKRKGEKPIPSEEARKQLGIR
jgi:CubicO group peptidase (beta-lactamase class C family)